MVKEANGGNHLRLYETADYVSHSPVCDGLIHVFDLLFGAGQPLLLHTTTCKAE